MSSKALPPLLEPYLALPPETSLILLTSTLGCSVNWLTARFLGSRLSRPSQIEVEESPNHAVLLVSWMRDLTFWRTEVKRATGLDLTKLTSQSRFKFLDFFTTPPPKDLSSILKTIEEAAKTLSSSPGGQPVTLILDNPDLLLATSPSQTIAQDLSTLILNLRSLPSVHDTILTLSADSPFLSASTLTLNEPETRTTTTPLETATASFAVTQAHAARLVLSVRELETGAARDVSGVLRVTRGGDWYADEKSDDEDGEGDGSEAGREKELLYLVQRDGSVKVFGRGEGGGT